MFILPCRLVLRIHSWHNPSKAISRRCFAVAAADPSLDRAAWVEDPTYRRVKPPSEPRQWLMPEIPKNILRPHYASTGTKSPWADIIPLAYPIGPDAWYDKHLEEGLRNACRTTAECLQYAISLVKPGVSTAEIDEKVTAWAFSRNCYPSSLNYGTFPGSLCTSVDNVLAHGVPNE